MEDFDRIRPYLVVRNIIKTDRGVNEITADGDDQGVWWSERKFVALFMTTIML